MAVCYALTERGLQKQMASESESRPTSSKPQPAAAGLEPELKQTRHGAKPGDVHVRLTRYKGFRRVAPGRFEVRSEATTPRRGLPRLLTRLKRLLIGEPLATAQAGHERLTKAKALAVLSSDALS